MRVVIQRVKEAQVKVEGQIVGKIAKGLVVFLAVARDDDEPAADYLVKKIAELRIFEDAQGKMNISAQEAGTQYLVVSQFTLYGNCDKGRRPSFDQAADPARGEMLYNYFVKQLAATGAVVSTGQFRAMMEVSLINEGPVTFIIDSKQPLTQSKQ
ncbi:MAG: D-tyrosyl-tRNA(Tyr) deacylase [Candidatus Omnitrophica bacterium]|nr:D-tyrosyl-tRNA(Tyr) deacylase [Candidatus Omnitrophota bacterium]MDE2223147.1 D-tyrosyl-tRNA(Tyr) deacylase [Candidatus Omnitrophota bacterium]